MPRVVYSELYKAIQQYFDPDEMTADAIAKWLGMETDGRRALAEELSVTKEVLDEIRVLVADVGKRDTVESKVNVLPKLIDQRVPVSYLVIHQETVENELEPEIEKLETLETETKEKLIDLYKFKEGKEVEQARQLRREARDLSLSTVRKKVMSGLRKEPRLTKTDREFIGLE